MLNKKYITSLITFLTHHVYCISQLHVSAT